MRDMRFKTAERRCLVHGLKRMLKTARKEKKDVWPAGYEDNYWKVEVTRKNEEKCV